jgi:tetratricopeptide (TPR) repeat protein
MPKQWGNVARRGARSVGRPPGADSAPPDEIDRGRPAPWEPDQWVEESGATAPAKPGRAPARRPASRRKVPPGVSEEIGRTVGAARSAKVEGRLLDAASAFERDRIPEALRILRPLSREAPGIAAVRELTGLALYRVGRWSEAARHLEAFRALTGSVEQHPVLADCYRALGRFAKVDELWDELRAASPEPALLTEGRIVAAGSLADRGDVRGAIRLLERGPLTPKRAPAAHHLRLWYALADLSERAGDAPRARELFRRVVAVDPELADAVERLQALG